MNQSLLEDLFSASERLPEQEFVAQFPGPFLLQTRFPQKPSDFDASFDTAAGSLQTKNTKEISMRPVMPGDSQRFPALSALKTIQDLLQYHALFVVKKSQRNTFPQGITIGRTNNNDVVIQEPTVSKFHAWIQPPGPGRREYVLYDANSHYGTMINYAKIESATLSPGAKLRFGSATMLFLDGAGLHRWYQEKRALMK